MAMAELLVECGAVRFGHFTLTSGKTSDHYIDVKAAMTDPNVLGPIAQEMAEIARTHGPFDYVAGMELGAVPIATAVSLEANLRLLMIRKQAREHGTGKRIEGLPEGGLKGARVLVVEDVTTTAGSTKQAIEVLREAGATVTTATVVVDREAGGSEVLAEMGVTLYPLARVSSLLAMAGDAA